jgi:hypothetical protein
MVRELDVRAFHPLAGLALVLASLGASPIALGDGPHPGDAVASEAIAASLRRFDEGRAAFEKGEFEEARRAFEASNKLQASPNSLLYIGRCYRETGKIASAYVTLVRSAREANARLETTLEKRYAATRDAAAAEAIALEPRVPRLTLAVPSNVPDGFELTVNGVALAPESWGIAFETDPGPVVVRARGARMRPFATSFMLAEGERHRVDVVAERVPTATIAIAPATWPSGLVLELDGAPIAPNEITRERELDVGPHRLTASAPAYVPWRWEKALADGQHERIVLDLKPAPPATARRGTPPWLFFAVAGAAVVAAGIGGGLAIDATARDHTENAKNPFVRSPEERDSIRAEGTLANAMLVSGAVLGISAAVLFFTTGWRAPGARP